MHVIIINLKGKKKKKWYTGGFGGRRGKEKCCNFILISKRKRKTRNVSLGFFFSIRLPKNLLKKEWL